MYRSAEPTDEIPGIQRVSCLFVVTKAATDQERLSDSSDDNLDIPISLLTPNIRFVVEGLHPSGFGRGVY